MKKILLVGGEDISLRLPFVRALIDKKYEVVLIGNEEPQVFEKNNISYYRYKLNRFISPIEDLKSILELRKLIKRINPDIVHGFDTKPAIYSVLACFLLPDIHVGRTINGVGQIFSENNIRNSLIRPIYFALQACCSLLSNFTVFQNSEDKKMFESKGVIPNNNNHLILSSGVNFDDFPVKDGVYNVNAKKRVILVTRIIKNKGVLEYLEAARILSKKNKNYEFYLVGPITSEGKYAISQDVIESYKECVRYLGVRKDVHSLLVDSDLFVLPSYYREGVPRVLLEAGAAGLPLISTDMPGCNDVVIDSVNGFLVQPRSVSDLVDKIEMALKLDSTRISEIREFNINYIRDNFSLEKVTNDYVELYNSLS